LGDESFDAPPRREDGGGRQASSPSGAASGGGGGGGGGGEPPPPLLPEVREFVLEAPTGVARLYAWLSANGLRAGWRLAVDDTR